MSCHTKTIKNWSHTNRSGTTNLKSRHRRLSFKKAVLKNFAIFTGNHRKTPVLRSLFHNVLNFLACNFIIKRLQDRCFPANIAKFLRISKHFSYTKETSKSLEETYLGWNGKIVPDYCVCLQVFIPCNVSN